jgi:hypothetical protein
LLQPSDGHFDSLVRVDGLFFQSVKLIIMKNRPPLAFGYQVLRRTFTPPLLHIPRGRDWRGWAVIIWAHRAACEARSHEQTANHRRAGGEIILFEVPATHKWIGKPSVEIIDF